MSYQNRFYEIKIKGATVFLSGDEINSLLKHDTSLFSEALKRGKGICRQRLQKERERAKFEQENEEF